MTTKEKISIIGTGFVGLVTSAIFADRDFQVIAVDIDHSKVESVNNGEAFFFEPRLQELLTRVVKEKKTLIATTDTYKAIKESSVTFICVGTPSLADGSCDLRYIEQSAKDIGLALAGKESRHLIIAKSTILPGTTRNLIKKIIEDNSGKKAGQDFDLCMNPEFLREGQSVYDTIFPDRIIIGQFDQQSGERLETIYQELYRDEKDSFSDKWFEIYAKHVVCPPIVRFTIETAECIKYANNSFLATKISFINEFANICERIEGVDINDVAKGIGYDFRINPHFLRAGAGFGGSCFPKDVNAIMSFARKHNYEPELLQSVLKINEHQARRMVELVEFKLGSLEGKRVCLLGLSFKPETDDMRSAPSIKIANYLLEKKANVVAWDPKAIEEARKDHWIGEKIIYAKSLSDAIKDSDICLIITEWQIFKELTPENFKIMKTPIVVDGRRIYEPVKFKQAGVEYLGIGLGIQQN
ncbi:MAG: UDP-glucose/GDP-mannose dehydrogenase family protein [Asgard group archaeon]|nr:UDP-glucose/GDP-mannose dehydrogenase family protein [Asgard group archaeon]